MKINHSFMHPIGPRVQVIGVVRIRTSLRSQVLDLVNSIPAHTGKVGAKAPLHKKTSVGLQSYL